MKRADFAELVTCLSGDRPPRVWSLLITVFGELAQKDGARISGALLRHLSDLIGFKPEAARVALHRLRKDGWIESRRQGRNSDYFLTDRGRRQSAEASPRIYAERPLADRVWLVVQEPGTGPTEQEVGGAWLTPNLFLSSRPVPDAGAFVAPVEDAARLPDWMRLKLCDPLVAELARKLTVALAEVAAQGDALDRLGPCERTALRVLIVHDWRRIALKSPVLPDDVFPADWPVPRCREMVVAALRRLPRQDLETLEASLAA
jgi:phenylacetic acid degradation operon negative regulatory protein